MKRQSAFVLLGLFICLPGIAQNSLQADGRLATEYYTKGAHFLGLEDYEQAIDHFNMALQLNRKNPDYRYARGLANFHLEKYHSAVNDLERAIGMDSNQSNYYYYLGSIYRQLGDYETSIEKFRIAIEKNNDSYLKISELNTLSHIGVNYIKMEKYEEALLVFNKLLTKDNSYESAYVNRGIAAGFLERYDQACSDFTAAAEFGNVNATGYMRKYCNKSQQLAKGNYGQ